MTALQWIWQQPNWPDFFWQDCTVQPKLRALHDRLGQLKGKASLLDDYAELSLDALLANTSPHPRLRNLLKKHRVLLPPLLQCFLNR